MNYDISKIEDKIRACAADILESEGISDYDGLVEKADLTFLHREATKLNFEHNIELRVFIESEAMIIAQDITAKNLSGSGLLPDKIS